MGCGTSSTPVKEFKPRRDSFTFKKVENHTDHNTQKETRIKSASSKSSKKSSKNSEDGSRSSSASSRKKERVNSGRSSRTGSGKSDRYRKETHSADHERNIQSDAVHKDDNIVTDSKPIETIDLNVTEVDRTENKDDTVGTQELRNTQDITDEEDKEYSNLDLTRISIPVINRNKKLPDYTLDDIVNNNTQKGRNNWFLYGRKVYSIDLFVPIIFQRVQQYLEMTDQDSYSADEILSGTTFHGSYPVYVARGNGVRKKELIEVLRASQIGLLMNMSREEYLARLKHCVDNVKTDLEAEQNLSEYLVDYLEQLSRWLSVYPNVELEAPVDRTNVDPNQCEFPLPDKIRADSTVIRKWAREWKPFDLSIDEDGAWTVIPLLNEDMGDVHQTFADIVAKREVDLPGMDMEIDGEAAWNVIQLDIVKKDETTQEQNDIWNARAKRKDLNDPKRMKKRRQQLADGFLARHDTKLKPENMTEFLGWADRLEKHWKEFQELCETFVRRRRLPEEDSKVPDTKELEPKGLVDKVKKDDQKSATNRSNSASSSQSEIKSASDKDREDVEAKTLTDKSDSETNLAHETVTDETKKLPDNIPPHDTMSLLSEHGAN